MVYLGWCALLLHLFLFLTRRVLSDVLNNESTTVFIVIGLGFLRRPKTSEGVGYSMIWVNRKEGGLLIIK